MALSREHWEWWAAGTQSVYFAVALSPLISSVFFFSSPGLEPFSLDTNIFQYDFSSIHCAPPPPLPNLTYASFLLLLS